MSGAELAEPILSACAAYPTGIGRNIYKASVLLLAGNVTR